MSLMQQVAKAIQDLSVEVTDPGKGFDMGEKAEAFRALLIKTCTERLQPILMTIEQEAPVEQDEAPVEQDEAPVEQDEALVEQDEAQVEQEAPVMPVVPAEQVAPEAAAVQEPEEVAVVAAKSVRTQQQEQVELIVTALTQLLGTLSAPVKPKQTRRGVHTGWHEFQQVWHAKMKAVGDPKYAAEKALGPRSKMCSAAWKRLSDAEKEAYKVKAKATVAAAGGAA